MELAALIEELETRHREAPTVDRLAAAATKARDLRELGDRLLDHFVQSARTDGCSWNEIGTALGVSKQAAQQRFVAEPRGAEPAEPPPWPEHFDEPTRRTLVAAQAATRELGHNYLGTEHVLLAMTADEGLAGAALTRLGITSEQVNERILRAIGPGHRGTGAGPFGVAPRFKRALEAGRKEARRAGHRCARSEHLLLAMSAQRDGMAALILRAEGVSDDTLRNTLADLLEREDGDYAAKLRRRPRRRGMR